MVRLHVEPERMAEDVVVATDEDHKYLTRVLRLEVGDRVTLFDGAGAEADAEIARVGPRALELHILERRAAQPRVGPELVLLQGLARGEKLDLVVQKATELGVHRIVPISTERVVPRLEAEASEARRARWRKIAREAARQCGRADLPEIDGLTAFDVAISGAQPSTDRALKLLFWEDAKAQGLREVLAGRAMTAANGTDSDEGGAAEDVSDETAEESEKRPGAIVIAVGPEGGFSSAEVGRAKEAGFLVAGLGPRVLRTETAALAALAIVNFALGDMG